MVKPAVVDEVSVAEHCNKQACELDGRRDRQRLSLRMMRLPGPCVEHRFPTCSVCWSYLEKGSEAMREKRKRRSGGVRCGTRPTMKLGGHSGHNQDQASAPRSSEHGLSRHLLPLGT